MGIRTTAWIDLPLPRFNPEDEEFLLPDEVLDRAYRHFETFVNRYRIRVYTHRSGLGGKADGSRSTVWVPKIKTLGDFWVAMHEVGHIVAGLPRSLRTTIAELIVIEYEADMFALKQCQALGLSTECECHGKRNVFKYVKCAHKTGIKWAEFGPAIHSILVDWLGIHEAQWQAHKIDLLEK